MLIRHRNASRKLAERWWWLLPRAAIDKRLEQLAADLYADPSYSNDLIDEAIADFKANLDALDKEARYAN